MNPALWRKAFSDAWFHLLVSSVILIAFAWIFLWLMSLIELGVVGTLLKALPPIFQKMLGVSIADLVTNAGRASILFVHLVTMLICLGWAIGRGSDPISGEIGRGTMDLLASLPVHRPSLLVPPAVMAAFGAAILAASVWLGIAIGLTTIKIEDVTLVKFFPGVVNLFSLMFCLSGFTTFVSSWARDRWRTIFITIGFFLVSTILKLIGRMWAKGEWIQYLSFLSAFQPQELILLPEMSGWPMIRCNAVLLGLGLISYLAAAIIFWRRDVPMSR
jgi:ABC-2 type transport system permease protein